MKLPGLRKSGGREALKGSRETAEAREEGSVAARVAAGLVAPRLRADDPLCLRMLGLYRRAAERMAGKMLLSPLDLHTNMDLLAALRRHDVGVAVLGLEVPAARADAAIGHGQTPVGGQSPAPTPLKTREIISSTTLSRDSRPGIR